MTLKLIVIPCIGEEAYHAKCFRCILCQNPIEDLVFTQTSKVRWARQQMRKYVRMLTLICKGHLLYTLLRAPQARTAATQRGEGKG